MTTTELTHAAELLEDAANYLTDEHVLPCDEGNALAESLATLSMNLRRAASTDLLAACKAIQRRRDVKRPITMGDLDKITAAIAKAEGR